MKSIPLTKGKLALVDDSDFKAISKFKWYCDKGYARRTVYVYPEDGGTRKRKEELMHRVILKTPAGMQSDHIDGNRLNNQRCNLRICSTSQNSMNRGPQKNNSTSFKGVAKSRNRFRAYINVNRQKYYLGHFKTAELASAAYQKAAAKLHGKFAHVQSSQSQS